MKDIRVRFTLLIIWLVVFYGIVILLEPLGINQLTFLLVCTFTAILLIMPITIKIPLWVLVSIASLTILLLKIYIVDLTNSIHQALTLIEIIAATLSIIIANWVNQAIFEFEVAVQEITIGQIDKSSESVTAGQGSLYREVRRARNHHRPLSILAIGIDENSIQTAVTQMLLEAQSSLMKQVVLSRISNILCEELEDCDIVVLDHNQFLVALPETQPEDIQFVTRRLHKEIADRIGINLHIGAASLPQDGYTLEGLIDQATNNAHRLIDDENSLYKFNHFQVTHTQSEPHLITRK